MTSRSSKIGILTVCIVLTALALAMLTMNLNRRVTAMQVTTSFDNGEGLRPGVLVRIAGVDVGRVTDVQLKTDHPSNPVWVIMSVTHDFRIPADAIARLSTAGVLGETFVDIDISEAHGQPLTTGGTLRSESNPQLAPEQLQKIVHALIDAKGAASDDSKRTH